MAHSPAHQSTLSAYFLVARPTPLAYGEGVELLYTGSYRKGLKRLGKLGATAEDIDEMEKAIVADPEIGDVIQDTGGMRKVRFAYGQTGKSGGGRTIYYVVDSEKAYLITCFAKVDQEDLTAEQKKLFKKLVKELTDG